MSAISHQIHQDLGALLAAYPRRRGASMPYVRVGLFLCGMFILIAALFADPYSPFVYTLLIVWAALGAIAYYHWAAHREDTIMLFEQGIVQRNRRKTNAIRWESIVSVIQHVVNSHVNGIPLGTFYTFTICADDGSTIKVNHKTSNVIELGIEIQRIVHPQLLAKALSAYNNNQVVIFGRVTIDQNGLRVGSKQLAWQEVRDIEVAGGYTRIRKQGRWLPWAMIDVAKIPNLPVFLELAQQRTGKVKY